MATKLFDTAVAVGEGIFRVDAPYKNLAPECLTDAATRKMAQVWRAEEARR